MPLRHSQWKLTLFCILLLAIGASRQQTEEESTEANTNEVEDDGCIERPVQVEEYEYPEVRVCKHVEDESCIESVVTKMKPAKINKCGVVNSYKRECRILTKKRPVTVKMEVCHEREIGGDELCEDQIRVVLQDYSYEDCSLVPREGCVDKIKMIPSLERVRKCTPTSREICTTEVGQPKKVQKTIIRRICPNHKLSNVTLDCGDLYKRVDYVPGLHKLKLNPNSEEETEVYCDDQGWTVIQSRGQFGNPENYFLRGWDEYRRGFGDPTKEFWLGLDNMFFLTNNGRNYSLRITARDFDGVRATSTYASFRIGNRARYNLRLTGYEEGGMGGDSLYHHRLRPFSTFDKDLDIWQAGNCAERFQGGWWYGACHMSNLNGLNLNTKKTSTYANGIVWKDWHGYYHSLREVQMAVRDNEFSFY